MFIHSRKGIIHKEFDTFFIFFIIVYCKYQIMYYLCTHQNDITMGTITLTTKTILHENKTTKYWREVECMPQTVELKTWGGHHPLFILKGIIVASHDEREIGMEKFVHVQTYNFFLEEAIAEGTYIINGN